jgi:periplasmic divalent cation tolerance protein
MTATVVMTTVATSEDAAILASGLVEARLAACVQELPITSTYRWEGSVHRDPEILLLIKTTSGRAVDAVAHLEDRHPYDTPEIVTLAADAARPYLAWLAEETGSGTS